MCCLSSIVRNNALLTIAAHKMVLNKEKKRILWITSVTWLTSCRTSESHSVIRNSLGPYGLYSPWNSPGQKTGVGSCSLLQRIFPTQGSNPGFTLQADSLPAELPGKPKHTGVGSLSLCQWIFLTQKSNRILQEDSLPAEQPGKPLEPDLPIN